MNVFQAIIYGVVQGLTEFLPISSSGHLVLLNKFFGISDGGILMAILLHIATLMSIIIVMRKTLLKLIKKPFGRLAQKLYLASGITFALAFVFRKFLEESFLGRFLPWCFLATAAMLVVSEVLSNAYFKKKPLSFKMATGMGLIQGVAMLPGISRSGSTISAGLALGGKKDEVADFSFLMSIPIILASLCYELLKLFKNGASLSIGVLQIAVACIVAFIVGVFGILVMRKLVAKAKLWPFAVYLTVLSIVLFFIEF